MPCRIVPFVPGRRPTDEDTRPGLGSSDSLALVTGDDRENRTVLLIAVSDLPEDAALEATVSVDGRPLPGWERRPLPRTPEPVQRLTLEPERDLATLDLGFAVGFLRSALVRVEVVHGGAVVDADETALDLCDVRNLGTLYDRVIERLVRPDTQRQARAAGVSDPGAAYHPWYPVLTIGGDKAALYTAAVVADIVGKEYHLTDPVWLLRVGVYLELLTCVGIFEAVRAEVGDLLEPEERAALDHADALAEIRRRIRPDAWRDVWARRRISFPTFGRPRVGPVSALNLLRKRDATLVFLHAHHEDLKHAIELAGPNHFNAQETWQRVFRDAERAVLRQTARGSATSPRRGAPAPGRAGPQPHGRRAGGGAGADDRGGRAAAVGGGRGARRCSSSATARWRSAWLEALADIMERRLARRRARLAERGEAAQRQSLLTRIRQSFFGP